MMSCAEFARWFSPYVDGVLAPDERRQLENHLGGCVHCRGELASLQQMLQTLRTMGPPTVPELLPGIHQRLEQAPWWRVALQRFTAPWPASLPWHGLALATTAALVAIMVVVPAYRVRFATQKTSYLASDRFSLTTSAKRFTVTDKKLQLAQAPAQASQFSQRARTEYRDASSRSQGSPQYEPYYDSNGRSDTNKLRQNATKPLHKQLEAPA